jgi:predicted nucleotidyltransferase
MNKATKYGLGSGLATLLIDGLLQYNELNKKQPVTKISDFTSRYDATRGLKNTAIGISVRLGVGYVSQEISNRRTVAKMPFNKNEFLKDVIKGNSIDKRSVLYQEDKHHLQNILAYCAETFENLLVEKPFVAGSVVKRTATSDSDHDIALVFSKSPISLENLHNLVEEKLTVFRGDNFRIRQQNRSIGLIREREDGTFQHIDILPAKARGNYNENKDLTILDRRANSHLKTNINIHNSQVKGEYEIREAIKLMKTYKSLNGLPIPSPVITNILADGFKRTPLSYSKAENLKASFKFLIKVWIE